MKTIAEPYKLSESTLTHGVHEKRGEGNERAVTQYQGFLVHDIMVTMLKCKKTTKYWDVQTLPMLHYDYARVWNLFN